MEVAIQAGHRCQRSRHTLFFTWRSAGDPCALKPAHMQPKITPPSLLTDPEAAGRLEKSFTSRHNVCTRDN